MPETRAAPRNTRDCNQLQLAPGIVQVPFAAPREKLVNTRFTSFFDAQKQPLDFILDLISEKQSAGAAYLAFSQKHRHLTYHDGGVERIVSRYAINC